MSDNVLIANDDWVEVSPSVKVSGLRTSISLRE